MEDENALLEIMQLVRQGIAAKPRAPLGFAGGSGIGMADDFDASLEELADYT